MNLRLMVMMMTIGASPRAPAAGDAGIADMLPPLARNLIHRKMQRHADDMVRLVIAVTLLQRDKVQLFANDIASEPRLTRPIPGEEDALNASLPEKLFVLQEELRGRAKTLANSARGSSDDVIAADLGRLMQTCVACHSAFLPLGEAKEGSDF